MPNPTPPTGTKPWRRWVPRAARRSRRGWRCAPLRSAPGRWPVVPTCCAATPRWSEWPGSEVRAGQIALRSIEISVQRAAAERDAVVVERAQDEHGVVEVRARVRELAEQLDKLTDTVHRDELLRAEQRLRIEQLEIKISDDFGIGLDDLIAEYGPAVPVPPLAAEVAEYELMTQRGEQVSAPKPAPYDRAVQTRRAQGAERDLALLGKVNPLALEEFAALE